MEPTLTTIKTKPRRTNPTLWKDLAELAHWIERNCLNCRYREGGLPGLDIDQPCPLPYLALQTMMRDELTPKAIIAIACRPSDHIHMMSAPTAPYKCWSRRDKRGRPRNAMRP